ncbi:MAG: TonB-dependent receptor [Chitinophagaceae bacterium]|nr:TonB-dependent receptor [Chitinophagaceae bacterium]
MKSLKVICIALLCGNTILAQEKQDTLKQKELKTIRVESRTNGNQIDALKAIRTERLGQTELKKNACCNLAESFESNPSVEVSFNNAVTGARQIQMLGLSGIYVQMMTDVLPTVRGLNYTFGFANIPSTMVHSIYINKGPGSVTNGFESMTGQIDVELMKPEKAPRFFVNAYLNNMMRQELNINAARTMNKKWSTLLMTHGSTQQSKLDKNKDGFLDQPLTNQLQGIHRWKYSGEHIESMFGVKGMIDQKQGGQLQFDSDLPKDSQSYWGFKNNTKRWEVFLKGSYNMDDCGAKSLGIQTNFSNHDIRSFYGKNNYRGIQNTLFANLIYQTYFKEEYHQIRTGGGILYDDVHEHFKTISIERKEPVVGIFTEYTYTGSEVWSLLLGARADYNVRLKKAYFIPRANFKYSFTKQLSMRLSAGSGFRTANIFAENPQVFVSNRTVFVASNLNPEYSWNYGMNLSYCYKQHGKEGRLSVDLFRTDFQNQIVADFDQSPQEVHFYNLQGTSYAWYAQAEWYHEVIKNLDVRLAYKFNDVRVTQQGVLTEKMLNAKHRVLGNIAYMTRNKHWRFDFTTQWLSKQRLPDLSKNPEQYRMTSYSPSFFKLMGQITYAKKLFEIYAGSENLNNFTQQQLIVDAANPNGNYFDAGNVWGPAVGRMLYLGFRYTIN